MAAEHQIRIAALSACLALVRPVGMTEDETLDWLEAAADTLAYIPAELVQRGAALARRRCTHHSQIVPAIIDETKDALAWHGRPAPVLRIVAPAPREASRLTLAELPDPATLQEALKQMGLEKGWIVERADGRLEWSEEDAA